MIPEIIMSSARQTVKIPLDIVVDQHIIAELRDKIAQTRCLMPTQLAIETVRACNADCIMCPSSTMKRERGIMTTEMHQTILKKISDWGAPISIISHAGLGEPLLDTKLEDRIKNEKKFFPNAQIVVYTNGSLLSSERSFSLIESGVDVVSVSINAFRKDTYKAVMKLERDTTYGNVAQFLEMKQKSGSKVTLHVSLVKTDLCSLAEVEEFKQYWESKQIQVITPPWISWGNHLKHSITKEQLPCFYIWKVMMIDHDGTVKMCCEDYDSQYPMGNLMKQTPSEIFNAPRMLQQRENQLNGNFLWPEICKNCIETHESAKAFWQCNPELAWDGNYYRSEQGMNTENVFHYKTKIHKTPSNKTLQETVQPRRESSQMKELLNNFIVALESLTQEQYKSVMGHMLAKGLEINNFDYPQNIWPPPTPARLYINKFLHMYKNRVKGRCVEFSPPVYKEMFRDCNDITSYDVWNVTAGDGVTIIADLQCASNVPSNYFDTIILVHVLSAICDVWKAVGEVKRILKPNGLVLCTVPSVLQGYAPHPKDYWRFTKDSLCDLFADFSRCEMYSFGNAATVAGSPFYLMTHHYPEGFLSEHSENCPSIITAAAWK